jgi:hypothetical protein
MFESLLELRAPAEAVKAQQADARQLLLAVACERSSNGCSCRE